VVYSNWGNWKNFTNDCNSDFIIAKLEEATTLFVDSERKRLQTEIDGLKTVIEVMIDTMKELPEEMKVKFRSGFKGLESGVSKFKENWCLCNEGRCLQLKLGKCKGLL